MTAQARDTIIYKKEEYYISTEPLASYLGKVELPHKLVAPSTDCWRGYYSKWAIDNNKLFLIEWQGYILDYQEVGMVYLFPDKEIVFADWFSGSIRIAMGEIVSYVHGGYGSVYEGEMFLVFENGVLVNEYTKWLTKEEIEKILKDESELPF